MRPLPFLAALAIDALAGDPEWSPHPVRAIGVLVDACDRAARETGVREHPLAGRCAGIATVALVAGATYAAGALAIRRAPAGTATALEVALAASSLAWRSLIDASALVERALVAGDLYRARACVARIVGRDTEHLGEAEICRATIETLAESLCDGVAAPLVYLVAGGVPSALAYKAINTMDSMIGHIDAPYRHFGWCAARVDDLANLLPARLAAAALVLAAQLSHGRGAASARVCLRDARRHRSPNAGWTEAAAAGALGVRLGGRNSYAGATLESAVFGAEFTEPGPSDVRRAMRLVTVASALMATAGFLTLWVARATH